MHMLRAFLKQNLEDLKITTPLKFSSEMDPQGNKNALVLYLCQTLGAATYISGILGKNYLEEEKFQEAGIEVKYQHYKHPVYRQGKEGFIPNLGILDLLFHHGPESLRVLIENNMDF